MADDDEDKTIVLQKDVAEKSGVPVDDLTPMGVPPAHLICLDASNTDNLAVDQRFSLKGVEIVFGRDAACDVEVASRKLSRRHARIFAGAGCWGVQDLNSTNGVFVNGSKITTVWLKHRDEVRLASIPFRFELERPEVVLSSSKARRPEVAAHDDEDESDRTMMAGSLQASEAVLAAAKEAEKEIKASVDVIVTAAKVDPENLQSLRGPRRFVPYAAAALVTISAITAWSLLGGVSKTDELVAKADRLTVKIVEHSHQQTVAQMASYLQQDIAALSEMEKIVNAAWQAEPSQPQLANIYARLLFLRFEREYSKVLDTPEIADSLATRMAATVDVVRKATDPETTELVTTVAKLTELAKVMTKFRRFSQMYNPSATNPQKPSQQEIDALIESKNTFNQLRRLANSSAAERFIIFRTVVNNAEERDLTFYNEWRTLIHP